MTWTEIYNKYKDTELMKKFDEWYFYDLRSIDLPKYIQSRSFEFLNIKDIYGHLFVFAKSEYDYDLEETIIGNFNVGTPEELMIYRTEKFFSSEFEVAK